jgi:hypothetical protein
MVKHARNNGLTKAYKINKGRTIDHMSQITDVWLDADPDKKEQFFGNR